MNGIEMMLANLLGMKPKEMRERMEQAVTLMETGANAMKSIQSDLAKIKSHLNIIDGEEPINGGQAIANRGNSANNHNVQL